MSIKTIINIIHINYSKISYINHSKIPLKSPNQSTLQPNQPHQIVTLQYHFATLLSHFDQPNIPQLFHSDTHCSNIEHLNVSFPNTFPNY